MLAQSFLLALGGAAIASASPLARQTVDTVDNGAVAKGCFRDLAGDGLDRTFGNAAFNSDSMTNDLCSAHCTAAKYAWSGTQYYDQCYCSNDAPTVTSSDCDTPCSGDDTETEICGGSWALTTYKNEQIANVDNYASSLYSRVGCLADSPSSRALVGGYYTFYDDNSIETCGNYCKANYPDLEYFGVKYSFECFCGSTPTTETTSDQCTTACPGNSEENCGGTDGINTFQIISS